jgi:hypothetical protein
MLLLLVAIIRPAFFSSFIHGEDFVGYGWGGVDSAMPAVFDGFL